MLRAAALSTWILACATPAPVATAAEPALGAPAQDRRERRSELEQDVFEATRAGEYDRVRALIGQLEELEIEPLITAAGRALEADDLPEALELVERALEQAPEGPTARMVHGDASLELGRRRGDSALLEQALASYHLAAVSPPRWLERKKRQEFRARATLGASYALTALGRHDRALEEARDCLEQARALGFRNGIRNRLVEWPEKRLFDAAFDVYVRLQPADVERAGQLAVEMEAVLESARKRAPQAVWPYTCMAALYLGEGRYGAARQAALDGLARDPSHLTLPGQLSEAARGIGGSDEVQAAMAILKERSPEEALPWWYSARERFDNAVGGLGETPVEEFEAAEADFRRCRELQPEYGVQCLGYEAMCRGAVGWTRLGQERIEDARAAFRSMEALYEGGLRAELPGLVGSGIEGLDRVGRELFERDRIEDAAAVYQTLHAYEPGELVWALRAGRYHRDAGARMLVQAEAARRRSSNPERDLERSTELLGLASVPRPGDRDEPGWQAALARVDVQLSKRAVRSFEHSYAAFRAAAELAPEDVAVLTEAAELVIQYLHRDDGEQDAGGLDWARATLERCIELGRTQLEDPGLDEDRRIALREAWGDAHQDLGVLALEHDGDREAARRWFEQSLAIGPYPRPIVKDDYLPRCAARGPDETPR